MASTLASRNQIVKPAGQVDAVNAKAIADLGHLMQSFAQLRNVPLGKVIRNASRDFVQAAIKNTPQAQQAKTTFLVVPGRGKNAGFYHWVNRGGYFHKGGITRRFSRLPPGMRRRNGTGNSWPTGKGFAKASWIGLMHALGMGKGAQAKSFPGAKNYSQLQMGIDTKNEAVILLHNWLSYISKLDRRTGLVAAGCQLASQRMTDNLAKFSLSTLSQAQRNVA